MKQERARAKREHLVGAAADLLQDEGWSALTHRGLSARSGVPLASLTYYFDGVDDMVAQAASELARRHLATARATVTALPRRRASAARTAALVVEVLVGPDPTSQGLRSLYERYLQAGRTPTLAAVVRAWNAELHSLVAELLERTGRPADAARVALLVAALDGLLVTALAEGDDAPVAVAVTAALPLVPGSSWDRSAIGSET